MTPQEALLKAADLIEQPGKWTQHKAARDVDGRPVAAKSPKAVCFCALGALDLVTPIGDHVYFKASQALSRAVSAVSESIARFNDAPGRTAQEVADAMRKAAAL